MAPREHFPHHDPRERMTHARGNLALAVVRGDGVLLESLCFNAQQAAEEAIKGMLLARGVQHPSIHDLAALLSLVEGDGVEVPDDVFEASLLTPYAGATRYPGHLRPVTEAEYERAVGLASRVVRWVEDVLKHEYPKSG